MTDKMTAEQRFIRKASAGIAELDRMAAQRGPICGGDFWRMEFTRDDLVSLRQALTAPRVPEGAFRILVAAGNRIAAEAEEVEGDDGMAVQILLDYWHEFLTALERTKESLTAAPAPADELATLRERVRVMEALIAGHNAEMDSMCADKSRCGYAPYKRNCPNCPTDYKIEAARLRGGSDE